MQHRVKVNLGSGPDGIGGWINFDWGILPALSTVPIIRNGLVALGWLDKSYRRQWPKIRLADLRGGIPLASESVDWIYNSNFLEHLKPHEAVKLLKESWRVLRPGGKMRLVLPDLEKVVDRYIKSKNGREFNCEFYGFDKDKTVRWEKYIRGHEWMYDYKMIKQTLTEVGFSKVKRRAYRVGEMPDIKKLDIEIHRALGLYLEAEKNQ